MIITLAILSLMITGIYYETDCLHLILQQRKLQWICSEMADAAAESLVQRDNMTEAEQAAEAVLQKNAEENKKHVWNMTKTGNTVTVKVSLPAPDFRLVFLDNSIHLSACSEQKILPES